MSQRSLYSATVEWTVPECRGCGREYRFLAPVKTGVGNNEAIARCAQCGTTTRTDEKRPRDQEGEESA